MPTGIPDPDKPGHWLVPPWPNDASFSDVVRHFLRFHPCGEAAPARLLAYFTGYEVALGAAAADPSADDCHRRWCENLRDCVRRCARLFGDQHRAEAAADVDAARAAARGSGRPRPLRERTARR